ncbi:J domain-containing protein CG6693 [Condylostylus longicornis]|uniref:J domain-containing protein CG6693 n=1 Tax=Condylostylus longicornis TaxID=2530218 RepID=UPI00244DC56E|nr:J domain-containing protein CG6693 [Condylostylus longicornis]
MPSTLELCEKYFGTQDIYEILSIEKTVSDKEIKKAYYRLSLKVHPDRVPEEEKQIATEKFKVLSKLNEVLTDKNKKSLYDEKGIIDDDDDEGKLGTWLELWRKIFKPITKEDIDNFKKEYIGSDLEKRDILKAYTSGKGCIDYMMQCVPFMDIEDEPRIKDIVLQMIKNKEVPEYKIFTNEPESKKKRRHKKYTKERKAAAKEIEKINKKESLEQQIMKKQQERSSAFSSLIDRLSQKYGNEENESDDPEFDISNLYSKKKAAKGKKSEKAKKESSAKANDRRVKRGRVTKK